MRRKENYAMRKLAIPKRVSFPGRTFFARYERIKRQDLPANIQMRRTYKQRAAPRNRRRRVRAQQGRGIKESMQKILKHPAFRAIAKKGLEYAPGMYATAIKRIKNKKVSNLLNSNFAKMSLNQAIKAGNRLLEPDTKTKPLKKLPPISLD